MKSCSKCQNSFPATREFFYARGGRPDVLASQCKKCHRETTYRNRKAPAAREKFRDYVKKWREENPDKIRAQHHRQKIKRYGLTLNEYKALLETCSGKCWICGDRPEDPRNFHIDHNHETNEVRGLLCIGCNVGLGAFRDDPSLLSRAIDYLSRSKPATTLRPLDSRGIVPDSVIDAIGNTSPSL